jgi:putative ABC transport system permease protein
LKDFNKAFEDAGLDFHVVRWEQHQVGDMYNRTMSLLSIFRNFVVTIILAISILAIFNTMMKLVKERTRELGTLRSLGFTPSWVLFTFICEAVILSIFGGFLGSVFAIIGTLSMNALGVVYKAGVLVEPVPFRIMISLPLYFVSFILLSLISASTTWIVCRSTLKVEAADNLTHS